MGNRFYISFSHGIGKIAHCDHANTFGYDLINLSSCRHPGDDSTGSGVLQRWHYHDEVIKWKHVPRYWPFVRGIHWSPVDSPHKGQWRGMLLFSLIYAWTIGWANYRDYRFETPWRSSWRHCNDVNLFIRCGFRTVHNQVMYLNIRQN